MPAMDTVPATAAARVVTYKSATARHATILRDTIHRVTERSEAGFWMQTACGRILSTVGDASVSYAPAAARDVTCKTCLRARTSPRPR